MHPFRLSVPPAPLRSTSCPIPSARANLSARWFFICWGSSDVVVFLSEIQICRWWCGCFLFAEDVQMLLSSSSEMIYCRWWCGGFLICGVHSPSSPICVFSFIWSILFASCLVFSSQTAPVLDFFECQLIFSPVLRHKIFVCVSSTQDLSSILWTRITASISPASPTYIFARISLCCSIFSASPTLTLWSLFNCSALLYLSSFSDRHLCLDLSELLYFSASPTLSLAGGTRSNFPASPTASTLKQLRWHISAVSHSKFNNNQSWHNHDSKKKTMSRLPPRQLGPQQQKFQAALTFLKQSAQATTSTESSHIKKIVSQEEISDDVSNDADDNSK